MLVSIIIPVYNVENYIRRCLTSVAEQTYQELEVIVVNDGSPDQSQLIIDEFCERYPHFHSLITENHGLGGARNNGLEIAHGEYVCFLDSDDYIAPEFVEKLVEKASRDHSDIVVCNNIDVYEDTGREVIVRASYSKNPTSLWETPELLFNRVCAWGKLYRRTLLDGLAYEPRAWYEDMRLTPKLYAKAKTISYIDDALLYYVIREGSIMTSTNAKRNLEIIDAFEDLRTYFKANQMYGKIQNELEYLMLDHVVVSAITRVVMQKDPTKKAIIKQLLDYANTYRNLKENPYLANMPRNRKIIYTCNTHGLYFITKTIFRLK